MTDLDSFRVEVRQWLEKNCPPSMRTPAPEDEDVWGGRHPRFKHPDSKLWFDRMVAKGWTVPTWPKEYGGAGLSEAQNKVLQEEIKRLGCRWALKSFGIWMLGPVLLQFGTEAQKREHLPKIARGQIRWCQGYSEPGAGSDLASLQTSAILQGDHFVVNGQKIWTSHADKADWIFCLVRTDPNTKRHEGISFLLIDMANPGVSVRPIKLISGSSPFCETFFDDVRVPAENLVGNMNAGWVIAKTLLEHERAAISALRDAATEVEEALHDVAKRYLGVENGKLADASLRDQIARADMDFLSLRLTLARSAETIQAGKPAGPESSMFKLYSTELNKRRRELRVLAEGYQGLGWEGRAFTPGELQITRDWLRSRANSIEGGTSEIQLNIIAKRVLGLPD
jgi:alkylation response protein AidB-like acyl-CoA dehydrogenase